MILLFGYVINRAIENFKSRKIIDNELEKKKIEKLNEIYSALDDFENAVNMILTNRFGIAYIDNTYNLNVMQSDESFEEIYKKHPETRTDIDKLHRKLKTGLNKVAKGPKEELKQLENTIDQIAFKYFDVLSKNRFWLSQKQYDRFVDFFDRVKSRMDHQFATADDIKVLSDYQEELNKHRLSIYDLLKEK